MIRSIARRARSSCRGRARSRRAGAADRFGAAQELDQGRSRRRSAKPISRSSDCCASGSLSDPRRRLAVGGNRGRSGAAAARGRLDRRSDRRHARLSCGLARLGDLGGAGERRPAGGCRALRAGDRRIVPGHRRQRRDPQRRADRCERGSIDRGCDIFRPKARLDSLAAIEPRIHAMPRVPRWRCDSRASPPARSTARSPAPNSHDWDLAAADLLVHEAGGLITTLTGQSLIYNRPESGPWRAAGRRARASCGIARAHSRSSCRVRVTEPSGSRESDIMADQAHGGQLLHLVFGGELTDLDTSNLGISTSWISSASIPTTPPPMRPGRRRRSRPSITPICATSSCICTVYSIRRPTARQALTPPWPSSNVLGQASRSLAAVPGGRVMAAEYLRLVWKTTRFVVEPDGYLRAVRA